jgi:hypothetical protein
VTDDDYHEGQIERVDPKNNEIFLTLKRVPMSQIVRFKRELNEAAEGEHGATYFTLKMLQLSASRCIWATLNPSLTLQTGSL